MTRIPFTKMVGTGNDFIVVEARRHRLTALKRQWPAISRALCDRHAGIGADGLLVLEPSRRADVKMRVFNPDGSEAEMCGNGARCVAQYIAQGAGGRGHGARGEPVTIETMAGVLSANVRANRVAMRMPDPTELQPNLAIGVNGRKLRMGFVNTGVPHAVVATERLEGIDVNSLGRQLRFHRAFSPRGSNVNFVQPAGRTNRLRVRTYERGVEHETLACGTGVVASAVIHVLRHDPQRQRDGRDRQHRVQVITRSRDVLTVTFTVHGEGNRWRVRDVVLEGPTTRIFEGVVGDPQRRRA